MVKSKHSSNEINFERLPLNNVEKWEKQNLKLVYSSELFILKTRNRITMRRYHMLVSKQNKEMEMDKERSK